MRKTILKTVIITFAAILAAAFAAIGVTALAAPAALGDFCSGVGIHKSAAVCYRRAYESGGGLDRLVQTVDEAGLAGDGEMVAEYSERLVLSPGFKDYCVGRDGDSGGAAATYDYYCYVAIRSLYENGKKDRAAIISASLTSEYTHKSPLGVAIMFAVANDDAPFARLVRSAYEGVKSRISDAEGKLSEDVAKLDSVIQKAEKD